MVADKIVQGVEMECVTKKGSTFYFLLLLCVVIPIFAFGLSNHGLWTADEPRVAEIGREMAETHNWVVPALNKRAFLEEPPLYYAALALAYRVFGVSDSVARIPSAIFACGGVVALFLLTSMFFSARTGFIAGFIMATCGEYFRVAHWVIVDSALACFVILAMTFFAAAYMSEKRLKRLLLYGLCYICVVFSFYTKGFIGVVIPGLSVLAFLLFIRDVREILRMHLWFGILIFLTMVLPWFIALWNLGGTNYLEVFLIHNHFGRFAGGSSGHHQPFYYYLTQFPAGFLPWSILIIPVLYRVFKKNEITEGRERKGLLLSKCWFIAGFLFLSVASTKRVLYLMPLFAPVSLMTAWYIERALKGKDLLYFERVFIRCFNIAPLMAALAMVIFYFFFGSPYGLPSSMVSSSGIVVFCVISAVCAIAGLIYFNSSQKRFWGYSSGAVVSLLILGLVVIIPILDRYKSFVPFSANVMAIVSATEKIYAYKPDETLRGAVPFYTGRYLEEVTTPELLQKSAEKGSVYVVIRDKRNELEKEIVGTGAFEVVSTYGDSDRSLVLLKSKDESAGRCLNDK
jgi:4-amino-4-deoxy-L-arabinose transferase-like glycosyltransferase